MLTRILKTKYFCLLTVLSLYYSGLQASNIKVSGSVSGIWATDTVMVSGDIEIAYGNTLNISPGCIVLFEGYFKITVWGKLNAKGDPSNLIKFERSDTTGFSKIYEREAGSWAGLVMWSPEQDPSYLEYCSFKYLKGGSPINLEYGASYFKHCIFQDNQGDPLVYIYSNKNHISNSLFSHNSSSRVVQIAAPLFDTIYFDNNTVAFNQGVGLVYWGYVKSVCMLSNNIFWKNNLSNNGNNQISYTKYDNGKGFDTSAIILRNCIVERGSAYPFYNASCFEMDPQFTDPENRDFSLKWDNYPIEDATRSIAIDNGYYLSEFDEDRSRSDIGAIPFYRTERKNYTWVKFLADTTIGYQSNLTVNFLNISNKAEMQATNWYWDFGDGSTSNLINPVHQYKKQGTYTVKLKATNQDGHVDSLILKDLVMILPGKKILAGEIEGIWEKKFSPYYVYGDVYVPDNKKLTIEPGVEIIFMGSYSFDVFGSLFAEGTASDTIVFHANDTTGMFLYKDMNVGYPDGDFQWSKGWLGIHFISDYTDYDTCKINFVKIRDVRIGNDGPQYKGTLKLHKVRYAEIKNSYFLQNFTSPQLLISNVESVESPSEYQSAGIASVGSNPIIEYNTFEELYQQSPSAIYALFSDSIKIKNNIFRNISTTCVSVYSVNLYQIENNLFDTVGLCLAISDPVNRLRVKNNVVTRNRFFNSYSGIRAGGVFNVEFTNNYFRRNQSDIDVCFWVWGDSIFINNNLFYKNEVTGAISNVGAVCINLEVIESQTGIIANNTIINNIASPYQSVILATDPVVVVNNILKNSGGAELIAQKFTTSWFFSNFIKCYNNNIRGGYSYGADNFDSPVEFVDSLSGDFRLSNKSTSINRGKLDTTGLFLPDFDFYGNGRIDTFKKRVDVGCAEYYTQRPSQILLSADSVRERLPKGTVIGRLSTIDPDTSDTHQYFFVDIPGVNNNNDNFSIKNEELLSKTIFHISENPQKVSIRSIDNFGASIDSTFQVVITVNHEPENTDTTVITNPPNIPDSSQIGRDTTVLQKLCYIYPNPFKSSTILKIGRGKKGIWQVYDLRGHLVISGSYENDSVLKLNMLPGGVYILCIYDEKKRYTLKIVKI